MEANERSRLLDSPRDNGQNDNIVFWNGPDDPENPINWPQVKAWGHVALVSILTFLVPLGATMFAPAIQQVMQDFGSTNRALSSLVISIYVLGWALGPLAVAPLSEVQGRLVVYTWSNVLYIALTICCALSPSLEALVLFRFLAGAVGSTPLTIGGGTISDFIPVQKRGLALSLYMFGPILGPSIGPFIGGYVTDALSWRWIFWILAIVYACATIAQILFMRETYATTILSRRTEHLQRKTGNLDLRSKLDDGSSNRQVLARAIIRPAKMAIMSPTNLLLSIVSAYVNGVIFLLLTTAPILYRQVYGFSPKSVGLAFLGYGVGNVIGLFTFTLISDRFIQKRTSANMLKPEDRLLPVVGALPTLAVGLLWYGWSVTARAHWMLAVAASALTGAGNVLFMSAVTGYLIDAFTVYAASAIAVNTVLRSIGGTVLPLVGGALYENLGWGWGSSLLALIALSLTPPLLFLYLKGEVIRSMYPIRL